MKKVRVKVLYFAKTLMALNFNIREMKIFKLVDKCFDKFSGYNINLELTLLLDSGLRHKDQNENLAF